MSLTEKMLAAFVFWAVGTGLFFFCVNRWVLTLRDYRAKTPLMLLAIVLLNGGGLWWGWHAGFSPLFWPVLALLVGLVLSELRRLWLRRTLAGAPPVWQENVAEPLLQPCTTTTLAIRHYEVRLPHWRGPRLRIAHVTDLHVNGMLPDAHYRLLMERVQQAAPDLLLFTGDFLSDDGAYADRLPSLLGEVRGRLGTFAILGNHDYWSDPQKLTAVLHQAGIQTLGNGVHTLDLGGARVALWGCEDPWGPTPWAPPPRNGTAAAGRLDSELVLALSHTGDNVYRLARAGAHMVFSGHYHAGQWRLPYIGPLLLPSRFGRRFDHGHFVVQGAHLFVGAGVGSTRIPFRIYCRPDFFIVDVLPGD
jgi:predicted MPP superfamily phosphohydrolase